MVEVIREWWKSRERERERWRLGESGESQDRAVEVNLSESGGRQEREVEVRREWWKSG